MNRLVDLSIGLGLGDNIATPMVNFLMNFLNLKRCNSCKDYDVNCGNCSGKGFVSK